MTITTCPKCGSMNITTAGVCANCGWSQFAQVTTVSTGVYKTIGEIELKVSGKALLNDYKRLLFENNSLTARNAELEEIDRMRSEIVSTLNQANANNEDEIELLKKRIAKLKEKNETLKTACDILRGDNNLLFKRLMSIETPDDLQTLKIVYGKEDSEVQE